MANSSVYSRRYSGAGISISKPCPSHPRHLLFQSKNDALLNLKRALYLKALKRWRDNITIFLRSSNRSLHRSSTVDLENFLWSATRNLSSASDWGSSGFHERILGAVVSELHSIGVGQPLYRNLSLNIPAIFFELQNFFYGVQRIHVNKKEFVSLVAVDPDQANHDRSKKQDSAHFDWYKTITANAT